MFKELKAQDKASRLVQVSGQYEEGIKLYKAFKEALQTQDKARTPRLAIKLDSYYATLTTPQKEEFCALLVKEKLITGVLASVIRTFNGRLIKTSEAK